MIKNIKDLEKIKADFTESEKKYKKTVLMCYGASCISSDCKVAHEALENALLDAGIRADINVKLTGCMGTCAVGPTMIVLAGQCVLLQSFAGGGKKNSGPAHFRRRNSKRILL